MFKLSPNINTFTSFMVHVHNKMSFIQSLGWSSEGNTYMCIDMNKTDVADTV